MDKPQSFIHDLLEDNQSVETPSSWIYWSLMCCISAAAANNYTLRTLKGNLLYYPNIYVMLLGESGLGKGYGINLAKRLVQQAEITRVIAGRSSIQAIIKELATTRSSAGKPIITDSRGFIINGELSTAVISDPDSLTILTDLFDRNYNAEWTNLLKGDGAEKLKDPYITCLFGSSPAHFYDSIPQANIEGGYIGRNLMIYEEKRSKEVDLIDSEEEEVDNDTFMNVFVPKYVPHLISISKAGKTRLYPNESARIAYNVWRREWRANQSAYNDKTGFINRVPDHVIKIAMCLCLSRFDNEGIIIESDFTEAIGKISGLVYASQKTAEGTGLDPLSAIMKKVIDYLLVAEGNELRRQDLLIKGYGNYDPVTLDKIMETLMEMQWVKRERLNLGSNGSDWLYKLSGEPLARYRKFKEMRKQ